MAGYRWRNMYYLTGLPGWVRFGYSPGWGGLPPAAQYLSQTGQIPGFMAWMQQQAPGWAPPAVPMAPAGVTKEQEIQMLEAEARMIEQRLAEIKKRLEGLKG